ncbi:MAG: Dyp-type peroxidase [Pseudomonadota bacterium]
MALVAQSGILAPVPRVGRYLFFSLTDAPHALGTVLKGLAPLVDGQAVVAGLGLAAVSALGANVPGLREFPVLKPVQVAVPSTPTALWCWLRGEDMGELVLLTLRIAQAVAPGLHLDAVVDGFRYGRGPNGHGRDLTGYEDGAENPQQEAAEQAALVASGGPGLPGSSFVAVQQWVHDFVAFEALSGAAQDDMVGRRRSDNEELEDAPESAHVKRTAQESFVPEAFVVRRSMPWAAGSQAGLMFVAFGASFDAFEAQMRRMAGLDDGIVDALFGMSKPLTGAYLWCPPMRDGQLDLRAVGL